MSPRSGAVEAFLWTEKEVPQFCGVCGKALKEGLVHGSFDRQSGEPHNLPILTCPDGGWESGHEAWRQVDGSWTGAPSEDPVT